MWKDDGTDLSGWESTGCLGIVTPYQPSPGMEGRIVLGYPFFKTYATAFFYGDLQGDGSERYVEWRDYAQPDVDDEAVEAFEEF